MKHDPLFDARGEADEELARLEAALARHRWKGSLPAAEELPEREELPRAARLAALARGAWVAAAAVAALAIGALLWTAARSSDDEPRGPYRIELLAGELAPRVPSALAPGARIECDERTRVQLHVADIGRIELGPSSRLRIGEPAREGARGADFLLHLERGSAFATIVAAPRRFQLGTPAGLAVDLGCVYATSVDERGSTTIEVLLGLVSFETDGRRVLVPGGASIVARPGRPPSTPLWEDASPELRAALARLDAGSEPDPADLERVLAGAEERDSLLLWHFLADPRPAVAERAYQRLAALVPPPEGVRPEGVRAGDAGMLDAWRAELSWDW